MMTRTSTENIRPGTRRREPQLQGQVLPRGSSQGHLHGYILGVGGCPGGEAGGVVIWGVNLRATIIRLSFQLVYYPITWKWKRLTIGRGRVCFMILQSLLVVKLLPWFGCPGRRAERSHFTRDGPGDAGSGDRLRERILPRAWPQL